MIYHELTFKKIVHGRGHQAITVKYAKLGSSIDRHILEAEARKVLKLTKKAWLCDRYDYMVNY